MFEDLLKKLAQVFNSNNIPYMIIGGQAVLLYGEPRLTRDIDVTLGIGIDKLPQMLELLKKLKLRPLTEDPQKFVKETWVLPSQDEKTKIRVDFIFSFTPFEREAIRRAKLVEIGKTKVKFASVEDVVIHKIFAGRPRDLEDVRNILAKNPQIDNSYIKKWLKEFNQLSTDKDLLEIYKSCQE